MSEVKTRVEKEVAKHLGREVFVDIREYNDPDRQQILINKGGTEYFLPEGSFQEKWRGFELTFYKMHGTWFFHMDRGTQVPSIEEVLASLLNLSQIYTDIQQKVKRLPPDGLWALLVPMLIKLVTFEFTEREPGRSPVDSYRDRWQTWNKRRLVALQPIIGDILEFQVDRGIKLGPTFIHLLTQKGVTRYLVQMEDLHHLLKKLFTHDDLRQMGFTHDDLRRDY
jgi:hypothetical protein